MIASISSANAQYISGSCFGVVKINTTPLRLQFNISQTDNQLSATMVSLDQGNASLPVTKAVYENSKLTLSIANIGFEYNGEMIADSIVGFMTQGGMKFPLNLTKKTALAVKQKRPQEPNETYPYKEEQVIIKKGDVTIADKLTLPSGIRKSILL